MTNDNTDATTPSAASSPPPHETPPGTGSDSGRANGQEPAPDPGAAGGSGEPPPPSTSHRRARPVAPTALPTFLLALGAGLMAGGLALAAAYSRDGGEDGALDVPVYTVGLVATAVLLLLSVACSVWALRASADGGHDVRNVAGWSGAIAVLSLTVLLGLGLEDVARLAYVLGGVLTGLSVLGYALSRHGGFVVTAVVGLGVLYAQGFEDVVGDVVRGDHPVATLAAGLAVFVAGVTVLGWVLPTRVLSAQIVGWLGVLGCSGLLAAVVVVNAISAFVDDMVGGMIGGPLGEDAPFGPSEGMGEGMEELAPDGLEMPGPGGDLPDLTNDVWLVLAVVAGLVLLWLLAGARTKHPGFVLLAVVMPVVTVPLAAAALGADRPTVWIVALTVPAVVVLVLATLLAVRRR